MRQPFVHAVVSLLLACSSLAAVADEPPVLLRDRPRSERPQLLVVGTSHFGNPGRDVVNAQVPDVMSAQRQREIDDVVAALVRFKPTRVAVEMPSTGQAALTARYRAYRAGTYTLGPDESDQLGFRLAAAMNLPEVSAIDWNRMPPGQEADFDYIEWADKHGEAARLAAMRSSKGAEQNRSRMQTTPVIAWLAHDNAPEVMEQNNRRYFDYAMLGDSTLSPGANWVANWYGRNLRIFANLVRLAPGPSERVLVIYGAGHAFLLRQFGAQSGAFEVVDPMPLLTAAGSKP